MIATDVICELGDPDKLCGFEDHIVLKFDKPWQPSRKSAPAQLPRGLHLEDGGQRITATAESFVTNCGILCQRRVVAAVFAGCAAFRSCAQLALAARKVLAKAQTLVIVHNRDYVVNLVDWFRSVEVLVLHHDLRLQTQPEDWDFPQGPRQSQLKRLIGSAPAMGMDNLYVLPATMCALVLCCPYLCEVQTPMHDVLDPNDARLVTMLALNPPLLMSSSLILGLNIERMDGRTFTPQDCDIPPGLVTIARKHFLGIRRLQVTTWRYETIALIQHFAHVTDLSLTCQAGTTILFQRLLEEVLMQLRLKHLSLTSVSGVSLSAIAKNWPDLQSLSLFWCSFITGEHEISPGSLQNLANLRLYLSKNSEEVHKRVMNMLLKATTTLTTLRLDGAVLCTLFVIRCSTEPLPSLQRLTLGTDKQLPGLELTGDDLRCLVKALPSLQYAATDSYDLRLFFQYYMPTVTIDWCHCTTCAAEFPRLDYDQNRLWNDINAQV